MAGPAGTSPGSQGEDGAPEPVQVALESAPGGFALGARTPAHEETGHTEAAPRHERFAKRATNGHPGWGQPGGSDAEPTSGAWTATGRVGGLVSGIRQAGPLALAGFAVNAANVVVTLLVARLMTTRGYGALAQVTSLFLVVSVPGTAVAVAVVRRVTELSMSGRSSEVAAWARNARRLVTALVAALCLAALLGREPMAHLLGIPSAWGVFAGVSAGAVWVLLSVDRGLLQAHQAYRGLSANLLVEGGVRTMAVLCLVGAGLGVGGAAFALLLAELVTVTHARLTADRTWAIGARTNPAEVRVGREGATAPHAGVLSRELAHPHVLLDMGAALLAMALLAYLQNADVIVLGREAPHWAGPYAAISVASKALVFGAIALGGYLLPEAAIEWHRGGHALRQLAVTFMVLAIPGLALLLAAAVFPQELLSLVFSPRYVAAHSAFGVLALAMLFLSVTVVLTIYLLGAGQRWVGSLLFVGAVATTVALAAAHGAPRPTALADLEVQSVLALSTVVAFALLHARRHGVEAPERVRA